MEMFVIIEDLHYVRKDRHPAYRVYGPYYSIEAAERRKQELMLTCPIVKMCDGDPRP